MAATRDPYFFLGMDPSASCVTFLVARQEQSGLHVTVATTVERDPRAPMAFSNVEGLLGELCHARVLAKWTFFSFVTNRTLDTLGATDAAQPEA